MPVSLKILLFAVTGTLLVPICVFAHEGKPMLLPKPQIEGMPLMQILKERHSTREFSAEKVPPQTLSNLLWAAFGINRPDGKRTAPSAHNWQELEIYVDMADGLFLYDAKANALQPILKEDARAATGTQDFVKDVPIDLIYVADLARVSGGSPEDKTLYTAIDTGVIVENVYLFCNSAGLATVVRGSVDRAVLAKRMGLRADQIIIVTQSVGLPKK